MKTLALFALLCLSVLAGEPAIQTAEVWPVLIDPKRAEIVDAYEASAITAVRLKTERVEGVLTTNGWGSAITWRSGILTAWHNIDPKSETFVQDATGEWVKCSVVFHDVDFDVCYLRPAKPVVGARCEDGLPAWVKRLPFRVLPVKMLGSIRLQTDVPYGELHGASGGGIFVKGKCLGILTLQRQNEDRTVEGIMCPMFVIEALARK